MTRLNPTAASILLKVSAALWTVWGIVHIFAGVMTVSQVASGETAEAFHSITPAVDLGELQIEYPESVSAIMTQHGFNLAWFGAVTLVGSYFVWGRSVTAVFVVALVGGLADIGYFIAIDLPGLAKFPGPQMTYICATAIVLSFVAYFFGSGESNQ